MDGSYSFTMTKDYESEEVNINYFFPRQVEKSK